MTCRVRDTMLPKGNGVQVNGVTIPRDLIAREVQHHPSKTPAEAWKAAARALVVREVVLQEARRLTLASEPLTDSDGRRETSEEAAMRMLIEQEVHTPEPDEAICRRYYWQNRRRLRSPDIYEASHILFATVKRDTQGYAQARKVADGVFAALREKPESFCELAKAYSACSSAAQGGSLGQITSGQTTPEFEKALFELIPGSTAPEPVATRYGFHIIRLDRKHEGRELPFEAVAERIAHYLRESVARRATAQYIARLVSCATITGIEMTNAEAHRVF